MKRIYVEVRGKGPVYWMEGLNEGVEPSEVDLDMDQCDLEDEGLLDGDLMEFGLILEGVEVGYYEGEFPPVGDLWTDITKQKGKYVLVNDYFSGFKRMIKPFWVQQVNECRICELFRIELNDDEEFDPKKLQLIKSDYEVKFLPYGVVSSLIVYDGKCYKSDYGHGHEDKGYWDAFIYNDEQPYASSAKAVKIDVNNIIYPYDC
jgi:hypothetical protein